MLLPPDDVKVKDTDDDNRLGSNLTTNKTIKFGKSLFYSTLGSSQSHSDHLNDTPEGFFQKTPSSYKSEKPIKLSGINKCHLRCGCNIRSIVNGVREPILFIFAVEKSPGKENTKCEK